MTTEISEVPPGAVMVHEPHGFVRLRQYVGNDLDVVNAARVSFRKESEWERSEPDEGMLVGDYQLKEDDRKVLEFLMKNRHGTPFEHSYFQFHVRAPIFVFREWHRHRIGISINEESARYVELMPDFYYPDDEHVRKQAGKPGRYTFEQADHELAEQTRELLAAAYKESYWRYKQMQADGIAKEIARACLPVGIYSQMLWTCNARSLMSFLSLRNAPTALREIRDYAEAMERLWAVIMPVTAASFVDNGRIAP
jgi:thymidylate synthase (FAD)